MGHHVVQLAGDPGPLGGDGDLGLGVALALQPGGAVLQLDQVRPADPGEPAPRPAQHERGGHQDGQQAALEHAVVRPDRLALVVDAAAGEPPERQRPGRQPGGEREARHPGGSEGGAGVGEHQVADAGGRRVDVQQDLSEAERGGQRDGRVGVAAAEHHQQGDGHREQVADDQPPAVLAAVGEQGEAEDDQRPGGVDHHRVSAEPGVESVHLSSLGSRTVPPGPPGERSRLLPRAETAACRPARPVASGP